MSAIPPETVLPILLNRTSESLCPGVNHIQDRASWHSQRTWRENSHRFDERYLDYLRCVCMWGCRSWPKPPPAVERGTGAWGSKGCHCGNETLEEVAVPRWVNDPWDTLIQPA